MYVEGWIGGEKTEPSAVRQIVVLIVAMFPLVVETGCGKSTHSGTRNTARGGNPSGGADTDAGEGGAAAASGSEGHGGRAGNGGQPSGGSGGNAGEAAGMGGAGTECVEGSPCTCGERQGTTQCTGDVPACRCPSIEECEPTHGRCFELCGGDPIGNWVFEDSCLIGENLGERCTGGGLRGSTRSTGMWVSFLDGGGFQGGGSTVWDLEAKLPLACLESNGIASCGAAPFFVRPTGPLLFDSTSAWLPSCEPTACGVCSCAGEAFEDFNFSRAGWAVVGDRLRLPTRNMPNLVGYCVDGDELWLGGSGQNDESKASYKFRRRSCAGTPVPCAERTLEQCALAGDCRVGRCRAANGNVPECADTVQEPLCESITGCVWDSEGCFGTASGTCDFATCDRTPGCTFGPPDAPRCTGQASCWSFMPDACPEAGCSLRECAFQEVDSVSCASLDDATCAEAPGCTWNGTRCTGTTTCSQQSETACRLLPTCYPLRHCGGTPTRTCDELSVEACHGLYGCTIEW